MFQRSTLSNFGASPVIARRHVALAIAAGIVGLALCLPLIAILYLGLSADGSNWVQIFSTTLPNSIGQTASLVVFTCALSLLLGTLLAYLVTFYNFWGRSILQWLAFLPMAVPGYIVAFLITDVLSYGSFVPKFWRETTGLAFLDIRSVHGASITLALVLYPYVYAAARAAFMKQSQAQLDVARTLGNSATSAFLRIAIPQALPAIGIGVLLVALETLNDVGAVTFFGVQTITTGIYNLWLGQGNLGAAAQLALLLLAFVLLVILAQRYLVGRDAALHTSRQIEGPRVKQLAGLKNILASSVFALPMLLGFALPVLLLLKSAARRLDHLNNSTFIESLSSSLLLGIGGAVITMFLGLMLAYAVLTRPSVWLKVITFFAAFGYAVPGTVLAIGVIVPLAASDRFIDGIVRVQFGFSSGLILSGTIFAILFAYAVRFLTISQRTLHDGLSRISPNIDAAARSLGSGYWKRFIGIHIPLLRPSLAAAAILVFVDTIKELPATLLLRPFGLNTLATHTFELASLGQLEDAAVPALAIVLAGLIPVALLSRGLASSTPSAR